ncbi:hypothetical protein VTN77DRAFT_8791 [Rasamsonia byssochlamydoides]|uniref:uncharacterized protein n=1 Tax=Rasamsonia byssochlamydoides TaxID=89139 RepID=UPI003743E202
MRGKQSIADGSTRGSTERQISESTSRPKRRFTDTQGESKQNDDDAPKRQRVSRACDQCRSKKDKCDGVQPTCSTCTFLSRSCSYKLNPKKRGLPTGYIRTLELLWGAVFSTIHGSEDVVRVLLRTANIPAHIAMMGKEGENADRFLSGWKNSFVLKEIERLLSALEQSDGEPSTVNLDGGEDSPRSVEASNLPLELKDAEWRVPEGLRRIYDDITVSNATLDPYSTEGTNMRRSEARHYCDVGTQTEMEKQPPEHGHTGGAATIDSGNRPDFLTVDYRLMSGLSLPANAWHLFDIYFAYTHCWLPIIEKHDVLRTAFFYNDGGLPVSCDSHGSGNHAAMWAILSLTSFQAASASPNSESQGSHDNRIQPDKLYAVARNLIPLENGDFEIGHIQALLILTLIKLGQQDWTAAWMLIGHAIRISFLLGLDQPAAAESEPFSNSKPSSRRKHAFLGCFVLETLLASQIGRLPELRKEHVARIGFLDEDGLDEWHPWEVPSNLLAGRGLRESFRRWPLLALSTFNRLVSLCCILNDICCWKQDRNGTVSQLRLIGQDMDRWIAELPKTHRIDPREGQSSPSPPHVLGLHMAYGSVATAFYLNASGHRATELDSVADLEKCLLTSSRFVSTLRLYMRSYGVAATPPVFILLLNLADCTKDFHHNPRVPMPTAATELGRNLSSLCSQLGRVWRPKLAVNSGSETERRQTSCLSTGSLSGDGSPAMTLANSNNSSWSRVLNVHHKQLSLETPCPSLVTDGQVSQVSIPPSQRSTSINDQLRGANMSVPPNDSSMMMAPDPVFPLRPQGYRQVLDSSHNGLNPLHVDLDGYGPQRPRIAPDLDALFDELASLDGGDKVDNQPQFMQNLGFAPNAGVSDLFSEYDDLDALLMSPTQRRGGNISQQES